MDAGLLNGPFEPRRLGPDPTSSPDDVENLGDDGKERKREKERQDVPPAVLKVEVGLTAGRAQCQTYRSNRLGPFRPEDVRR